MVIPQCNGYNSSDIFTLVMELRGLPASVSIR